MRGHTRWRGTSIEARIYVGMIDGKRRYRTSTVTWKGTRKDTEKAAERELTRLLGEVDHGAHTGPDATVSTLLDRWWATHAATWSPSTAANYKVNIDLHVRPELGDKAVERVRTETIDAFTGKLRSSGLAEATIAKNLTVLRSAFSQAVRWGWIATSPVDHAKRPRVARAELHPPSPDQVRKLLALAEKQDKDWATMLRLDAVTGARRGELCGLQWGDLEGFELTIRRVVVRDTNDRAVVRDTTKSRRRRTVILDASTVAALKLMRERRDELAEQCGVKPAAKGFMFSLEPDSSRPLHPNVVSQRFRRLRNRAGLPQVRLHDLRHYVVTRLLVAGVPVADVSERVGHANAGITHALYSHPVTEGAARAAEAAAVMLEEPES